MPGILELASPETDALRQQLSELFAPMMRTLHEKAGAQFSIDILGEKPVQDFIDAHAKVLDSAFEHTPMSDRMRSRLLQSDYVFSGIKTFHELNEAFPSLLDSNGERKPFEQFLNDVRSIDSTYNQNYLRAEYNFVQASADMAGKWEQIEQDGDRYNLQYRTAGDDKVRPEHAALNGVTLPPSDPFWSTYYPPNGWNCRCTVVQVRKAKYPVTPHEEAMKRGAEATGKDTRGIFQFNAGQEQKTFPDYNPYTVKRCRDCDIAKGKIKLAFVPENELCAACRFVRDCYEHRQAPNFIAYKKEKVARAEQVREVLPNLGTGVLYQTRASFKRGINHAWNIEEMEMFVDINTHASKLNFVRKSPLGEGKDMTNPKDVANVLRKRDRGVTHYNVYELVLGTEVWEVKTEVYKNKAEAVYNLYKK